MPRIITYTCDQCGREKQASNHWFIIVKQTLHLLIQPFSYATADDDENKIICGETCLTKAVAKWCDKVSKEVT